MDLFEEGILRGFESGVSRVGFGGFGFEKYKKGEKVEPKFQASYNLNKTLEKYPEFTKEARTEIQTEFVDFPNLHVVNLEALASVLNFLKIYPNPTPNEFKDEIIIKYFSRLFPDKDLTPEERKNLITRLKAQFLKYIVAVKNFRNSEDE